jgi:hypothetical protein
MKNTKYIVEISTNKKNTKYQTVAQIKFKSKYDELDGDDKIEILKAIMSWSREEINNIHPEQD